MYGRYGYGYGLEYGMNVMGMIFFGEYMDGVYVGGIGLVGGRIMGVNFVD